MNANPVETLQELSIQYNLSWNLLFSDSSMRSKVKTYSVGFASKMLRINNEILGFMKSFQIKSRYVLHFLSLAEKNTNPKESSLFCMLLPRKKQEFEFVGFASKMLRINNEILGFI